MKSINMINPFKIDFKHAGDYCSWCYLENVENKEAINKSYSNVKIIFGNKNAAKNVLIKIVEDDIKKEWAEIIGKVLSKCNRCKFENPEIFKYLNENKIISS